MSLIEMVVGVEDEAELCLDIDFRVGGGSSNEKLIICLRIDCPSLGSLQRPPEHRPRASPGGLEIMKMIKY